jgi:LppP/LprE lipoprotein
MCQNAAGPKKGRAGGIIPGMYPRQRSALILATVLLIATTPVHAQDAGQQGSALGNPRGPGVAVPVPVGQCPQTLGCQYAERNMIPLGYRVQSLQVCGANCTTQYWVASLSSGQQLLEIDPVRGGAILAVGQPGDGSRAPVRVVMPMYGPNDPACCPSGYSDTTYAWNGASSSFVAGEPVVTPADQFPGYAAVRQELDTEGWLVATV